MAVTDSFSALRSNHAVRDIESLIHPYTDLADHRETGPLLLDRGLGIYVWDDSGKRYIDGLAGLWCTALGFGNEELIEAATHQLRTLSYGHIFAGRSHEPAVLLAESLKEIAPCPVSKVLFCSSGSEANDTQIKLHWYYNNALGRPEKKKIISRIRGYHGVTVASGSLTGLPPVHTDFDLPLDRIKHTDCPHYYRYGLEGESEEDFVSRLADSLRDLIAREGGETIAAFIAEPVMGAGGVIIPPKGYFEAITPILAEHDIALISDEVICGFGRLGTWWGCDSVGFTPSTISVAKALTSAYIPLGGVTISPSMYDALLDESRKIGTFGHGYTYAAHPVAAAVGAKAIEIYKRDNIAGRVLDLAPIFRSHLLRMGDHPLVGEARGMGLIGGMELVRDKDRRAVFDPVGKVGAAAARFALDHGLICRAIGDTIAICPPLIIEEDEISMIFDSLERAFDDTLAWVRREGI